MYLKCIFKVSRKMENLVCYKTLPGWQKTTIPMAFTDRHNTAEGTWALLTVLAGISACVTGSGAALIQLLRPVRDFATLDADDAVLLQGVVDCFFEEDGELVVVDFKTDRIGRTQIEERAEHYRPQLEAYSMALMRVMGKKVREKVLYFFSVGEEKVL